MPCCCLGLHTPITAKDQRSSDPKEIACAFNNLTATLGGTNGGAFKVQDQIFKDDGTTVLYNGLAIGFEDWFGHPNQDWNDAYFPVTAQPLQLTLEQPKFNNGTTATDCMEMTELMYHFKVTNAADGSVASLPSGLSISCRVMRNDAAGTMAEQSGTLSSAETDSSHLLFAQVADGDSDKIPDTFEPTYGLLVGTPTTFPGTRDNEFAVMVRARGKTGVASKDWSKGGKQW